MSAASLKVLLAAGRGDGLDLVSGIAVKTPLAFQGQQQQQQQWRSNPGATRASAAEGSDRPRRWWRWQPTSKVGRRPQLRAGFDTTEMSCCCFVSVGQAKVPCFPNRYRRQSDVLCVGSPCQLRAGLAPARTQGSVDNNSTRLVGSGACMDVCMYGQKVYGWGMQSCSDRKENNSPVTGARP